MTLERTQLVAPPRRPRPSGWRVNGDGLPTGAARRRRRQLSYRRLAVCLSPLEASAQALAVACTLAAERGAVITAIAAIEMPLEMPLQSLDAAAESAARAAVYTAHAIGDRYGISVEGVVLRAYGAGEAIVAEVTARDAQLVIVPAGWVPSKHRARLPLTAAYVLRHAPCRVMLIGRPHDAPAPERADESDTVFHAGRPSDYWPTGAFVDREQRDAIRRSAGNPLRAP
jgi:nucleotide-binding universal stress UspA family protein